MEEQIEFENNEIADNLIAQLPDDSIFVSISDFKGRKYVDIRKYFVSDNNKWIPTKKGIALGKEQFERLLKALNDNKDEIIEALK